MADGRKRGGLVITAVPIDSVSPHPKNKRKGDVQLIKRLIKAHGIYKPIVVQSSTRHILAGNHTWKAAKELGRETIECVMLDVDDKKAEAILIADNRASDVATWDEEELAAMLRELDKSSLEETGFDEASLAQLLAAVEVPDFGAAGAEDQSRLDERAKVKCPNCGHEFAAT